MHNFYTYGKWRDKQHKLWEWKQDNKQLKRGFLHEGFFLIPKKYCPKLEKAVKEWVIKWKQLAVRLDYTAIRSNTWINLRSTISLYSNCIIVLSRSTIEQTLKGSSKRKWSSKNKTWIHSIPNMRKQRKTVNKFSARQNITVAEVDEFLLKHNRKNFKRNIKR